MIIRLVKFKSALSDSEVFKLYDQRAPQYRKLSGLLQKYYIKDQQTGEHGAVYLWDSMQSMKEFQQSELSRSIPGDIRDHRPNQNRNPRCGLYFAAALAIRAGGKNTGYDFVRIRGFFVL